MTRLTLLRVLLAIQFYGSGQPMMGRWLLPRKWKRPILSAFSEMVFRHAQKEMLRVLGNCFVFGKATYKIGDTISIRKPSRIL